MELLSGLECGRSNFVILLALQFLCKTEATTTSTNQEFCFHHDREGSSHLQPFKNESWQTTSLGELLQQMLQCYDSRVRVEHGGRGNPTTVVVSLYILSIGNFQVRDMDFQLSFYFRQQWQDSRLAYGNHFHEEKITLGGGILEQLWLPQTYFVNKKGSSTSVDANFFVRIFPDGSLLVITKNTLTMDCYMDLRNFPFDVQKCNLTIESFGFTTKDVVYKWISSTSTEAVEQDPGLTTSEFDIGPIRIFESATMYKTGLFSSLKMELNFQRRSVYYLIQIYIPSGMIVVLSWISFWIDNQSIPARTALGITTVLAMTTLLFGVQSSLPSVPYIKAVDLFMIVSFANVFAALVEFAVVNYTSMREKERKESKPPKNTKNKYTVNPDIVMLNFRNLSYENDAGNEHHLQNGVTQNGVTLNGVTQNGVTLNGVTQNGVTQNGAIVNNIRNSLHKRDVQTSNGTVSEHNPPDQTFMSRDYPHVQEPPFNRPNRCRWRCKITANAIDAWSRVLFPLAYGLFIVAYWIIYSSANADKKSQ